MKKISYFIWFIIFLLGVLFYKEYFHSSYSPFYSGHEYYFSMLHNLSNWWIVFFWLLLSSIPVLYLIFNKKYSWIWLLSSIFFSLIFFFLVIWIAKWWASAWWFFMLIINFLILLSYFLTIFISSLALWNIVLKKINFKNISYNIAVKFGLWFGILAIILYYLTIVWFINVLVSYIVFFFLIWIIYYQRNFLYNLLNDLLLSLRAYFDELKNTNFVKYIFYVIFTLIFFYIFIWFHHAFIAYPTAWDANHAYMFYPKVIAEYGAYPWHTDFRPTLSLWTPLLSWVYNLWFWTWFSKDTWMISFNFVSAILLLFFSFMLINTLIKLLNISKPKQELVIWLWYILIITWLTSWMWAFLVFVDNKTDLAVLMYVVLALFMLLYTFLRWKQDNKENLNEDKKTTILFLILAGVFFAFANTIKPTATFDFFEAVLSYSFIYLGIFIVLGAILFVAWFLAYLKFRGFDKAISSKYSFSLMISGFVVVIIDFIKNFIKDKIKLFWVLALVVSFIVTLIFTKWVFGLAQIVHWDKINKDVAKIVEWFIAWWWLPVKWVDTLTWSLYSWLKKEIGSSYNEDNTRYVWYGKMNFWDTWWSFLVPDKYKTTYCLTLNKNVNCKNKILLTDKNNKLSWKYLNDLVIKIFDNMDKKLFIKLVNDFVDNIKKTWKLKQYALSFKIDTNQPNFKIEKELREKILKENEKNLLLKIKVNLVVWNLNFLKDIPFLNVPENIKLLEKYNKWFKVQEVAIPYRKLIPFNVVFNRSLQNTSSYYTDIGIIWILLVFIVIFALFTGLYTLLKFYFNILKQKKVLKELKSEIEKQEKKMKYAEWSYIGILEQKIRELETKLEDEKNVLKEYEKEYYVWKMMFAFASSTLVWWTIWLFVAEWIVWYNIWWIIWLIITTLIFAWKIKDKWFLIYVLMILSFFGIFLNLFRLSSQGGGKIFNYYRFSVWIENKYVKLDKWWYKLSTGYKIPYVKDDIFNMQFSNYKKAIKAFNNRTKQEWWIIWWTYMRYFIKNQNRIKDDQFLMYLWKLGSDDNIEKFYARLKDQWIKDIVLDPNIASVVMGTWNISLWYRYFWKVDKNGEFIEKWVFPHFVDLAEKWYLEYKSSNNLAIKYALIYKAKDLQKILWLKDEKQALYAKYLLIALPYIIRNIGYENRKLADHMWSTWITFFVKILQYRAKNDKLWFLQDMMDLNGIYRPFGDFMNKVNSWKLEDLSYLEQITYFNYISIQKVLNNKNAMDQISKQFLYNSIKWWNKIVFVEVK